MATLREREFRYYVLMQFSLYRFGLYIQRAIVITSCWLRPTRSAHDFLFIRNFSIRLVSFHFKISVLALTCIFIFVLHATLWWCVSEGSTMGAMRWYIYIKKEKHTLRHRAKETAKHIQFPFCFVSVFCFRSAVHCARFGCKRTYQTIGLQCIGEGIVAVRTRLAFNVSLLASIPDIQRNLCASIVNSVAGAVQLTLRFCHSKLT